MGVGVLALMAGFVMVLQDSKPAKAQVMSAPAIVARAAAPSKLHAPSVEAGPAVIETAQAEAPLAALSTAPNVAPIAPEHTAANKANMAPAAKTAVTVTVAANTVTPAKAGKAAAATKGQDEDVALLEAMFEHTGRKAPPKPTAPKN